ncbi:MAG: HPP family protein [Pseudomonadales bacterium]|nr:HPP family protein [Pseudomonadales bacterium]
MSEPAERIRWALVSGLLARLHLERVLVRYPRTAVLGAFSFVNGSISIGLIACVALLTQQAFIFPSLGATAFILYYQPLADTAAPRNVLFAHLLGAICGFAFLVLFGLEDQPSAFETGVSWARAGAAALSLGTTAGLMVTLRVAHPPAGATALIVSLGLMPALAQIPVLLAGVGLLLAQALVLNRLAGIPYPLWAPRPGS